MTTPPSTRRLSTADARRDDVLEAAMKVFAARGIHGTPTAEVAKAAGISQAYLFRLFPTKADLAIALVERCNERIFTAFAGAARRAKADGEDVLDALGLAYVQLLRDRDLLLLQLHAHAASPDVPEIRDAMRAGFKRLVELVQRESGAGPEGIRDFFAHGMLLNVLVAMDVPAVDEDWARSLLFGVPTED
jgi:AcrR family transcriptional regulator